MKIKIGFTLVEMMIVIAILGMLVALGTPGYIRSRDKARRDTCINNLRMIESAADQYRIDLNLTITTPVNITWLWPATATAKSVESYINKQLFCPIKTSRYVGGTNAGTIVANNTTIQANAVPHCVEATGSTVKTNNGDEFEHSI